MNEKQPRAENGGQTAKEAVAAAMRVLPPPSAPMDVAREFIEEHCRHGEDLKLQYWRGGWWRWRTSHWSEVDEHTIRRNLYRFTETAA
jgi:putative DNA primase/helicase